MLGVHGAYAWSFGVQRRVKAPWSWGCRRELEGSFDLLVHRPNGEAVRAETPSEACGVEASAAGQRDAMAERSVSVAKIEAYGADCATPLTSCWSKELRSLSLLLVP